MGISTAIVKILVRQAQAKREEGGAERQRLAAEQVTAEWRIPLTKKNTLWYIV